MMTFKVVMERAKQYNTPKISNPNEACQLAQELLNKIIIDEDREIFFVIALNAKLSVIGYKLLYVGTMDGIKVRPAEVFRAALLLGAHSFYIAHYHPSGDPKPSREDTALFYHLDQIGKSLCCQCVDSVILTKNNKAWSTVAQSEIEVKTE